MSKFEVNSRVKIIRDNNNSCNPAIGNITKIESKGGCDDYRWKLKGYEGLWADRELKLIEGDISMGKFYKVIKDTPVWEVGAILTQDGEDESYSAINDLFTKDIKDVDNDYSELEAVVENCPDFFERVYEVKLLGKAKYLNKLQAREAHEALYKVK
jgi:hypothetical protein